MIDGNNFRAFGKLILCRCVHYREWSRANAPHSQRWCWNCGRKQDVNKQEKKKTTNLTRTRHTVAKGTIHFEPLLFGMRRAHKRKMVFFVSSLKANGHKTQKRTENLIKKLLHTNRAPVDSSPRFSLGRLFEEGKKTTPPEESAAKAHVPYFYIQAACRRIPIRSREHGCAHTLPRTTCRARVNCWEAPQGCQKRGSTFIQRKCLECILWNRCVWARYKNGTVTFRASYASEEGLKIVRVESESLWSRSQGLIFVVRFIQLLERLLDAYSFLLTFSLHEISSVIQL